jgi:hypothetical protein
MIEKKSEKINGFKEGEKKEIEFLESSKLINQALLKYKEFEKNKIDKKELNNWLRSDNCFGQHDRNSYNCHSFVLMIMKHELDVKSIDPFNDIHINKQNWIDEDGELYEEGYLEHVSEESPGNDDRRMSSLKELEKNIIKNSEKFYLKGREKKEAVIKDIINKVKEEKLSRFVFMFVAELEESHHDFHSFIMLGLNSNEDDIIVLEKEMPGDAIQITNISNVFSRLGGTNLAMNINIPNQNIARLY